MEISWTKGKSSGRYLQTISDSGSMRGCQGKMVIPSPWGSTIFIRNIWVNGVNSSMNIY